MDAAHPVALVAQVQRAITGKDALAGAIGALTSALAAAPLDEALGLTGVILTKADGDARGGVALSVREITRGLWERSK